MAKCEVCGRKAEIHHVVNKSQGGIDLPLNYKYLCSEHHRGKHGPHKDWKLDMQYKIEMQERLEEILYKDFYSLEELEELLEVNKSKVKRLIKSNKIYKEGYKKEDIIFLLMGNKRYEYRMLESYDDFIPLFV
ncbi:HNH endonuclease [Clostridium lundense]|uniref:HNH endonuclease n=1 Tax=Clostridium lundense TaxID=319475 RepID=UPI0004815E9D|nr:HNH endonuclease signature motif containing protein [Clostridium lundense]